MKPSREVDAIIAFVQSTGLPHRVTSTYRPDDPRRHGMAGTDGDGLAVDFAGPTANDTDAMLAIFRALMDRHYQLHELIFWLPGQTRVLVRRCVKVVPMTYGQRQLDAHRNHVHVSVTLGTFLEPLRKVAAAMADDPNLANITGPVELHVLMDQEGQCTGYIIFSTKTGELHTFGPGAHYYGRSEVVA